MEYINITGNNGLLNRLNKLVLDEYLNCIIENMNITNLGSNYPYNKNSIEGMNFGTCIHEIIECKLKNKEIEFSKKPLKEISDNIHKINKHLKPFIKLIDKAKSEEEINVSIKNITISGRIDIILQNSIYDIKCYKDFDKNSKSFILQLILYYLLLNKYDSKYKSINKLCIYDFYKNRIYTYQFDRKDLLENMKKCNDDIIIELIKEPKKQISCNIL